METDKSASGLLKGEVKPINVGLELFYSTLQDQGVEAAHVDWRPPAGGNARLAGLLDRMSGRRSS